MCPGVAMRVLGNELHKIGAANGRKEKLLIH